MEYNLSSLDLDLQLMVDLDEVNETIHEEAEYIFDRPSVRAIFITLYSIVFILCVVGNLLVLLVVSLHWRMRHITKFCLANLAFADLCVGLFCVYQNLFTYLVSSWVLGEFLCKMYQFINGLSHTASILTLVIVCVERYLAILHPFKCKQILTKNRLRIIMTVVWLISGLYSSPRLYYMVTLHVPRQSNGVVDTEIICTARRTLYDSRAFDMTNSLLLFLLPLILMSVLYSRVGLILWRSGEISHFSWTTAPAINVISSSDDRLNEDTDSTLIVIPESEQQSPGRVRHHSAPDSNNPNSSSSSGKSGRKQYLRVKASSRKVRQNRGNNSIKSTSSRKSAQRIKGRSKLSIRENPSENNGCDSWKRISWEQKESSSKCGKSKSEVKIENHFHGGRAELKSRQATVKMLIVIVVVFALCNLPYHCRKFAVYWWTNFDLGSVLNTLALPLTNLCMYAHCAINPIIYSFMSSSFRASLRELLSCKFKKNFHNSHAGKSTDRLAVKKLARPCEV